MGKSTYEYNKVKVFGFRLRPRERQIFLDRAAALFMSPHDLAKMYVVERLKAEDDAKDLGESLLEIRSELVAVRQDIALSTVAVLQHAGKTSKEVAESFAVQRLGAGGSELK